MATDSSPLSVSLFSSLLLIHLAILSSGSLTISSHGFSIREATVAELQLAFKQNKLTSRQLVEFYLGEIHRLNPVLRGVIEVNPDALDLADKVDRERKVKAPRSLLGLHGIPILVKDNIATKDKMNTTAGSFALLGSIVPRNAFVVTKLIEAGAIILGKASLSEWAHFRGAAPSGWCARSGQGKNPYVLSADPCGSSSGSAISVAANMAAVTLGTETDGSILCPSSYNSVVGIKPTVGLTSRAGVIPITPKQDTVGPMCRTVADAVYVLDAIVGFDRNDAATREASKYIPLGGYKQFLKLYGLKKKRLGIVRNPFVIKGSEVTKVFKHHVQIMRQRGAVVVDNLKIANIDDILNSSASGSSSGSAISVAANMVAVSLRTETDGSILCPSNFNSVVGIKPTVGLTSRAGVIPVSPRQDTIGPICRTVADAVHVLDAIAGFDYNDPATKEASKYIPYGGYVQFLKPYGLKGKRLGIVRNPFLKYALAQYEHHLRTLRQEGAVLVDHLEIASIDVILNVTVSGEAAALLAEFKLALNAYLYELVDSPVRSLAEIIAFNNKFSELEKIEEFGQDIFLLAQATNGIGNTEKAALLNLAKLSRDGFEKVMMENSLDALVTPGAGIAPVLAIGGFPGISVPAGFTDQGVPFGFSFGGLKGTEPKLIEIAYGFEQATMIRMPPSFKP